MAVRWSSPSDRKLFAARLPGRLARQGSGARTPDPIFSDRPSLGHARLTGRATGRRAWLVLKRRPVELSSYAAYLAGLDRICT